MKIKIACVGAGYFAPFHLEAWNRIDEVEVVAICDTNFEKAKALAATHNIDTSYSSVEELLSAEPFDVVDIITPPENHLKLVQIFARNGKHIICQKPLAPNFSEASEIVRCTQQAGIRFMVHENFRFQPWYRQIKSLLSENAIGDRLHTLTLQMRMGDGWGENAYMSRQPYFQSMPRLLIYETGIHYIDVFRFIAGNITSVYARLRKLNPVIEGEDAGIVIFDFENGAQGVLDCNRFNDSNSNDPRYTFGQTTIEGNEGTIRLYPDGRITVQKLGNEESEISYEHHQKGFAGDCVYFTQRHFVDCYQSGSSFETNGPDYLKNLRIQESIYQSSHSRQEVVIQNSDNYFQ